MNDDVVVLIERVRVKEDKCNENAIHTPFLFNVKKVDSKRTLLFICKKLSSKAQ